MRLPVPLKDPRRARRGRRATMALALVALLASCVPSYVYRPTEMVNAETQGYPTARYPVPPEAPHGEVYVTSFGIVDMDVAPGTTAPMLHVRLAVANNSGEAWQVDTRQQVVDLGPEGRSRAAFVNTDVQGSPQVGVAAGGQRVLDLFYSLPAGMQGASAVPRFDFVWRLDIPGRPVVQRTPFERLQVETQPAGPYPPFIGVGLGWGPFWWYDPLYPSFTFYHPFILHQHYPVIINRGYGGPRVGGPPLRGVPPPRGGLRGVPPGGGLRGSPPRR
jgi:hypothetical protein